ncbi:unnamed protein product (mitochondrion) [Plasmodiophora brassicae]|uniref:Uncharacterized protein n=1 Tax=Plasmodiophora brassicae TaxID=37360 RepID=A0A3P3YJU6_PLABS|nr:unnamed protein product [Plasmodiophora brassicae]
MRTMAFTALIAVSRTPLRVGRYSTDTSAGEYVFASEGGHGRGDWEQTFGVGREVRLLGGGEERPRAGAVSNHARNVVRPGIRWRFHSDNTRPPYKASIQSEEQHLDRELAAPNNALRRPCHLR